VWVWKYASSPPEWKPVLTGALALLLLGSSFIAVGCFLSTLTRNQIVAGILSFCLALGVWILGWAEDPTAGPVMKAVHYLGLTSHMDDMMKGVLDLSDIVYYLSFIGFGLFLTVQSVESQRWRA
jgi:ABC-2 type transport system permease protein